MLGKLKAKLGGYLLYNLFLWASRNASFSDFQKVWNEAYQAKVEAEWMRLRKLSLSTKLPQDELGDSAVQMQKGLPSNLTLLKPGPSAGQLKKQDRNLTH